MSGDLHTYLAEKEEPKQERSVSEWGGEGFPPEGECECFAKGYADWVNCYIFAVRGDEFWARIGGNSTSNIYPISEYEFRPIPTERERVIDKMVEILGAARNWTGQDMAKEIYDTFDIKFKSEGE